MGRAPCCEKIGLKRGRWTAEEDDILMKYIQANGEGSWRSLPKNAGLLRCGKSCRLRWINYLTNNLKRGNITTQEEDIIIKLHASIGNKWSFIASQLPGRTDNEIKNYWNSHLSRKIDTFRRPINNEPPLPIIIDSTKKKGGRTSRATMKKKIIEKSVKESEILENKNNGELVTLLLPSTPSLGKETLPSCHPHQEIMGDGMFGASGESEARNKLLLCCPTYDQHDSNSNNDILGPHENNMKSMVGDQDLESGILSSNGGGGGDQSSEWDSTNSYLELDLDGNKNMDWEWELEGLLLNDIIVQDQLIKHDNHNQEEEEMMLSWLWDGESQTNVGDQQQGMEMVNDENQEALVAWLFS